MTNKEISQFKKDVSSELHQFAYDLEQNSEFRVALMFLTCSISVQIFDNETEGIIEFDFWYDETSNVSGNYLEFSKKFKAFKQQAEKLC